MRSAWLLFPLVLLWIQPGVAAAQGDDGTASPSERAEARTPATPADAADALVARGVELRKMGDDRGALDAFNEAFRLGGSPRALAQVALAEQALGRWALAYEHLKQALAASGDAWIAEHGEALTKALDEIDGELGGLDVFCNVPGALIQVDGRELGRAPLPGPVKVVAGQSILTVSAPGHFSVARNVKVEARGLARVDVTLTRIVESEKTPSPSASQTNRKETTSSRDWLLYGSVGLSALGVTAGVTGYVIREVNVKRYNDDARCLEDPAVPRSVTCADEATAYRRGETIAIIGFSTAAVFGGLAAYLWLSEPSKSAPAKTACAVGVLAVGCSGAF